MPRHCPAHQRGVRRRGIFKIGDRTSADEVAALMEAGGEFLVLEASDAEAGSRKRREPELEP
jgi:hypothetical protein